MKRKKFSVALGCLLVLTMLAGFAVPLIGSAAVVEIEVLNPKGQLEQYANQPLADREPLRQKLENGETVDIVILWYEKDLNCDSAYALGELLAEKWAVDYPAATVRLIPSNGRWFSAGMSGTPYATNNATYWKNNVAQYTTLTNKAAIQANPSTAGSWSSLASLPGATAASNPRPPILGTPWGPKTGVGIGGGRQDGWSFNEYPFERYSNAYAKYDAVIFGVAD